MKGNLLGSWMDYHLIIRSVLRDYIAPLLMVQPLCQMLPRCAKIDDMYSLVQCPKVPHQSGSIICGVLI
jgi:hypothetical protein